MLKKRLIFTLLYSDGYFCQSRNFSLQKVGDVSWLKYNYNFSNISNYIDELIILDISRSNRDKNKFLKDIQIISKSCFVPITVGGNIKSLEDCKFFLSDISDKILINTEAYLNPNLINEISKVYGDQSIIVGVDLKKINKNYFVFVNNGQTQVNEKAEKVINKILDYNNYGELLINSIDQDGTGTGVDTEILKLIRKKNDKPIIISGGVGNYTHVLKILKKKQFNAISTANLLNFIGDGLINMRNKLVENGIDFPKWNNELLKNINLQ